MYAAYSNICTLAASPGACVFCVQEVLHTCTATRLCGLAHPASSLAAGQPSPAACSMP